ncbi:MAG: 50S ribosomal protein L16 [Candidatus Hadarchaeales archaeon]
MPLRPGRCYRHFSGPAYTRKDYVKDFPAMRIQTFDMGNPAGSFPLQLSLLVMGSGQIRHNALEAGRMAANRYLETTVGKDNYHLKVRVYPHHIIREHLLAVGAGADRVSEGMRLAFGRAAGTAARVKAGQAVATVRTLPQFEPQAREALRRFSLKLPFTCKIRVESPPTPSGQEARKSP